MEHLHLNNERRSILDPHYSVLELLEATNSSSGSAATRNYHHHYHYRQDGGSGELLSESWQILSSSSENSDEEQETCGASNDGNLNGTCSSSSAGTSNNSFIMPRLSLSHGKLSGIGASLEPSQVFIVGENSSLFYNSYLPLDYRRLFKLYTSYMDIQKMKNEIKLLLVIRDNRELLQLVNNLNAYQEQGDCPNTNISVVVSIVLNKNDQNKLIVIKNCNKILRYIVFKGKIKLLYPSMIILLHDESDADTAEVVNKSNLLVFLHFIREYLTKESAESTLNLPRKRSISLSTISSSKNLAKKRKKPALKRCTTSKHKHRNSNDKSNGNKKGNFTWLSSWKISIPFGVGIGVGMGYFISYFISYTSNDSIFSIPATVVNLPSTKELLLSLPAPTDSTVQDIALLSTNHPDMNSSTQDSWNLLTLTVKNLYSIIKTILLKPFCILGVKGWDFDDPNRIIAMSYVLL